MIQYENLKRLNEPFETTFQEKYNEVIASGHYILGPSLQTIEKEFAAYHSVNYCVGVSNGLDAIILALKALNLPEDAEVIVPSNTYIATILAIVACNLKPVLVDPSINTYNIDPEKIKQCITQKTKVLLIVHLYGKMCAMDEIMAIKEKYKLYLIEDCAQAHGATYKNKLAGTFGEFGAFSFYPTKNLGALGDAGGIICNNETHYNTLLHLRNYGSLKKYYNDILGYNNRMDELQAAFLSVKLPYLNQMNSHRNKLASLYHQHLNKSKFILPSKDEHYFDVYHVFNIRSRDRENLQKYLQDNGVGTLIHYPVAPHKQKALAHLFVGMEFPIADEIHSTTLSIPCSFCHTESEIVEVIKVLNGFNA